MKLITVLNDIHEGSTMELKFAKSPYYPRDPDEYYIGDNIDLVNCKKKYVDMYTRKLNDLKAAYGRRFITGNHEAQSDEDQLVVVEGTNTGLMHGDFIFWGSEKSIKYRQKDHGAGFLKRGLWVNALEAFENGYDRPITSEDLARAEWIARDKKLDRLIVGHKHPGKRQVYKLLNGATEFIVLPRGINQVWI